MGSIIPALPAMRQALAQTPTTTATNALKETYLAFLGGSLGVFLPSRTNAKV